ncbi:MAG: twin-arginine translocase TatA/TatE family subunit [Mariniphaga sp.]|nr:twin-arginine translocase TatA/TatE family subunit [Mariniphaga sp.]
MSLLLILGFIGVWQIVLIVALILLMFGGKKIPELMSGIGKGMKDFKKSIKDDDENPKENPEDNNKKEPLK